MGGVDARVRKHPGASAYVRQSVPVPRGAGVAQPERVEVDEGLVFITWL